ncbi:nuclear transport factor 2 family protein [Gordonia sp. NB41Y]|uniref:nuclear transport factor 2 family protein n=1 Tax=Gordonia sp. NB41Y TaxID=875808 RepID=UPI0002BEC8AC|nr:nuclear transport factor 2 family protein [Gordonia sp. NB41Y]WLP92920.1 nuclear transport factor 2 family protein [Gordonia sp. NB41Y]
MSSPASTTLVDSFYTAYNEHAAAVAADLYAVDGLHRDLASGVTAAGRDEIARSLTGFVSRMGNARWAVTELLGRDDRFAVHYELTGEWTLRDGTVRPVRLPGIHVFILGDRMIRETMDFWSSAEFARQISGV